MALRQASAAAGGGLAGAGAADAARLEARNSAPLATGSFIAVGGLFRFV